MESSFNGAWQVKVNNKEQHKEFRNSLSNLGLKVTDSRLIQVTDSRAIESRVTDSKGILAVTNQAQLTQENSIK